MLVQDSEQPVYRALVQMQTFADFSRPEGLVRFRQNA